VQHEPVSPLAAVAGLSTIEPAPLARAVVGMEAHQEPAMIACLFCDEWENTIWLGGDAGYICRRHLRAFFDGWTISVRPFPMPEGAVTL
jgi:hypothetical protein